MYSNYRTQRSAYEMKDYRPRVEWGYPSAYVNQALGIEKEYKCHKPQYQF